LSDKGEEAEVEEEIKGENDEDFDFSGVERRNNY
jgi:hypothetical protein